jgi:hypothetical protein
MKRRVIISVVIMLSGWLVFPAQAAQTAIEKFSSGANGWAGTSELFTGTWSFTGGAARISFAAIGIGFPEIGTLSNTPSATSGSFTGNYDAAGIEVIGFSFYAPSALPASSAVEVEWAGSTSLYRRAFSVAQTGVWYHFSASLKAEDKSSWTVIAGSMEDFAAARQSVRRVALRVARTLTSAHQFVFDDIFIAGQPGGASLSGGGIVWDGLLSGVAYQVQSTTNLIAASWTGVESLTATGFFHATVITNAAQSSEAFRILFE